jgi:AcrR family transcriptional regulator
MTRKRRNQSRSSPHGPDGAETAQIVGGSTTQDGPAPGDGPALLTVAELADRSGVPVPSIHHYRRLGLLPEPTAVESKRFLYDERHVEVLKVVRLLRDRWRLSLPSIGELLPELLAVERTEPYSVEMWDQIVTTYLVRSEPSLPAARLLAAARQAFASEGYATVNVGQICEAAGIAKGSFYRYFDSKHDIFLAAALSTVDAVGEGLDTLSEPMSETKAVAELATLLKPYVPLYLEIMTRELRGETDVAGMASGITEGIAGRVSPHLRAKGHAALAAGRRVADNALLRLFRVSMGMR